MACSPQMRKYKNSPFLKQNVYEEIVIPVAPKCNMAKLKASMLGNFLFLYLPPPPVPALSLLPPLPYHSGRLPYFSVRTEYKENTVFVSISTLGYQVPA